ncbi:hypothetical protein EXS70_02700 [Candidatus Peribacteria bacterium]|nr:hypothetical protein [Candidatus Peribacteria bacterium]
MNENISREANEPTLHEIVVPLNAPQQKITDYTFPPLTTNEMWTEEVRIKLTEAFGSVHKIGEGAEHIVYVSERDASSVLKVPVKPLLFEEAEPRILKQRRRYHQNLRRFFPAEWIISQECNPFPIGKIQGREQFTILETQPLYVPDPDDIMLSYGCAEKISPAPEHFANRRTLYEKVNRVLIGGDSSISYDREELLALNPSTHLKDFFARMDEDRHFRTGFNDESIVRLYSLAIECETITDGMAPFNIHVNGNGHLKLIDPMPPGPEFLLKKAHFALQRLARGKPLKQGNYGNPSKTSDEVNFANVANFIRFMNAVLMENGKACIRMAPASAVDYGDLFDKYREAFARSVDTVMVA